MVTSETNSAELVHVPVPDDETGVAVGAVVSVTVLVGDKGIGVSVGGTVLIARVTVVSTSTGDVFGNEQAETAINMDKRKIWNLKFFIFLLISDCPKMIDVWFIEKFLEQLNSLLHCLSNRRQIYQAIPSVKGINMMPNSPVKYDVEPVSKVMRSRKT